MKHRTAKLAVSLVMVAVLLVTLQYVARRPPPVGAGEIGTFSSYEELKQFVKANTKGGYAPRPGFFMARAEMAFDSIGLSSPDYSATNIQVAGVDEADIVKTDGEYLYVVSGNRVVIIQAYLAEEAQILSEIELEGMPMGIFINEDRLIIFEGGAFHYDMPVMRETYMPYWSSRTLIKIYDVSDRLSPSLQRELSSDGNYVSSRMIGEYVYLVTNKPVYEKDGDPDLPRIHIDGEEQEIPAEDIYYCDVYDHFYMFTSIIAINTQGDSEAPTVETILLGASSNLYVSRDNIYLTFPVWGWVMWESQKTAIHRIEIDGSAINYVASGEVPGMVLNQFSMDEHDGYFRVATTTHGRESLNHVYVLDMEDLAVVGSLENLAPTERIYSARFMGDRAYLVTFEIIDPLFVIDLKDPHNPEVLGELKITGYSGYLHPYDENHLIGIGKEAEESDDGTFALFGGVKISLFDVSDVSKPRLVDDYEIGDRGTESPVLWDHKAFLFDRARNLMVLPVSVAELDEADIPGEIRVWARGRTVWQGAYVFHVSPAGFTLRGGITHVDESADPEDYHYYHWWSPCSVTRSLYIGDVLYTISEARVMMNRLEDLAYINQVELPHTTRETYLIGELLEAEPSSDEPWSEEPFPGEDSEDRELPGG